MEPVMVAFTTTFIGGLAANLSGRILEESAREVRKMFRGDPEREALKRCVHAGLVGALSVVARVDPEDKETLKGKLEAVFKERDTARELAQLLSGRPPKVGELVGIASDCDLDAAHFPGVDAEAVFSAFEAAFLQAAIREAVLRPIIQTGNLLEQTRLQRALLDRMDALVTFLREEGHEAVRIEAGTIVAENVVGGDQVFQAGQVQATGNRRLRARYLRDLAEETDRLPWGKLAPEKAGGDADDSLRLSDVYVALDTRETGPWETEEELRKSMAAKEKTKPVSAQRAIDESDRLVLLGEPGSGKTTLVNFLTHMLACAGNEELTRGCLDRLRKTGPWSHGAMFPVRVVLREFGAWRTGADGVPEETAGALAQFLQHQLSIWKLDGLWEEIHEELQSEEKAVFVLLDGLDEVPEAERGAVVRVVQDFAERYRHNRYLVTCRIHGYVGAEHHLRGFRQSVLAAFNDEQIAGFVRAWFGELAEKNPMQADAIRGKAEGLIRALKVRDLQELARQPLLLTVMTLLHSSYGTLPEDRVELYQDAVELLLQRWKGEGDGVAGFMEGLKLGHLRKSSLEAGIYHVAFNAHAGQKDGAEKADIEEGKLLLQLEPYLGDSLDHAKAFIRFIREKTGLLIRHKPEQFTFPHRTFQEFLAACHLVRQRDYPS
ncbi:MAG: NACHT domain-containing protein, partial [Desulfococcaceae bacterium]